MTLLRTIFLFEWQQLFRGRWIPVSLFLFLLTGLSAVHISNQAVQARLAQADSIHAAYQQDYRAVLKKFTDTLTEKGKAEAKNAGLPALVNYRLPQNAVKTLAPLAALSTGLMDIQSWHWQLKYTKNFNDATVMSVSNPMVLFAGNFDLAFVIIYFMPLLVLVCCYNLYSAEKDAGTLPLLSIYGDSIHRILVLKLVFRFLMLGVLLTVINGLGFSLAEKQACPLASRMLLWCLLTLLYLAFWVAIAYFVLALRRNGTESGLYMLSCWILLLVILPSLANTLVQRRHPVPMRDEIASYRRHQSEEIWNTPAPILADSFNRYNPRFASSINLAKDTLHLSTRSVAGYYDLLERRMDRVLVPFQQKIDARNRDFERLSGWNPASLVQQWFNTLAGTGLASYTEFFRQTDQYQKKWKAFLYEFHIPDKRLRPEDFEHFPVFGYRPPALTGPRLLAQALYLLGLVVFLAGAGSFVFHRKGRSS